MVQNDFECCFASVDIRFVASICLMGRMVLFAFVLGSGDWGDFAQRPEANLANTRGLASDRMSLSPSGHFDVGLMSNIEPDRCLMQNVRP